MNFASKVASIVTAVALPNTVIAATQAHPHTAPT